MKIAFISTMEGEAWGGSELLWSQAAVRMASLGFTVAANVKGWKNEAKQISKLEQSNCTVVRRWYPQTRLQRLGNKLFKPKGFYAFLDNFSPDLVVISQGCSTEASAIDWIEACLVRNTPYAIIAQAAGDAFWPARDEIVTRLAKGYTEARKSFFVSKNNISMTVKQLAIPIENAKVIFNPYNVSYTVDLPWPQPDETLKLACVARLDPSAKGQDLIFEVFRSEKWRSRPIEVSLFGNGSHQKSLDELRKLWCLDNIKLGGYVDGVEAIWKAHHALILPSRHEGLPLALVEAMLCARPAIVTDVAGNSEVIEDNVNGFIAKAPKAELLDEALERAWQRRDDWCEMGQIAAKSIREVIPSDPIGVLVDELKLLL